MSQFVIVLTEEAEGFDYANKITAISWGVADWFRVIFDDGERMSLLKEELDQCYILSDGEYVNFDIERFGDYFDDTWLLADDMIIKDDEVIGKVF